MEMQPSKVEANKVDTFTRIKIPCKETEQRNKVSSEKQNVNVNAMPTATAHTQLRSVSRTFILSSSVKTLQLFFVSLSLLHLSFYSITLSKCRITNGKIR
jgi:hypothetical protein